MILSVESCEMVESPAPALSRGLFLLQMLEREGTRTLEQLAGDTGWPKSSVLRVMTALCDYGAVLRDPLTKAYRARWCLQEIGGGVEDLKKRASRAMAELCDWTGQTIELYEFDGVGLEMVDRCEPRDSVVCVVARVGHRRDFQELDALTQVTKAFGPDGAAAVKGSYWYWQDGKRTRLRKAAVDAAVEQVRACGAAVDLGINSNGVRRYAAGVLGERGQLQGVMAIAQACGPRDLEAERGWAAAIARATAEIS